MKRGAERQLTKDGPGDDDEIEEIQDPQGFQKADESVLATRQIRGLPKRALAASKPPSLNGLTPAQDAGRAEVVPPPKFGGFAGFGAGTATSNPFTFAAQSLPAFASAPSPPDTAFKSPTLASPFSGAPTSPSPDADISPKLATPPLAEETDAVAFKYFKSLRGLNVSFLSAISAAVEKDPFFDVADLVESYKNLRTTIQSEFDASSQPSASGGVDTTNSVSVFGTKVPPEKTNVFSIPKPLAGSTEAPSKFLPTSESSTKTGGFTFPPFVPPSSTVPAPLPFGLASKPSETSSSTTAEPPKSAFTFSTSKPFASTSSMPSTPAVSFAAPASVEDITPKSAPSQGIEDTSSVPSSRPASTTPGFGSSSVPNFFANTKPMSAFSVSDAISKPSSIFGSSIFGGSSTESNKPSLFTPEPSDSKDTSKVNTTTFGNTTIPSSVSTSIFGSSSDKPASIFGSASLPKTTAFVFGKPGGSIGNPVGFGFGGSSSAGDTTTPGSSSSGFNFGTLSSKPAESLFSPPPTDKSTESTPQPDAECNEEGGEEDASKLFPSHTHDEEGEGEEDEETTYSVRCKVYRLSKSEDKSEWRDLGIGIFRLKKHKVTDVRRALMRNSNTGRILINFRIYGSLKPSLAKTSISFIGYENNVPTSFRIRVKTEEQAGELKQAIDREIAAVPGPE